MFFDRRSSIFRIMSGLHFCLVLTIIYHNNILSQHSSKRENLLKLLRNSVCSPIAAKHNNLWRMLELFCQTRWFLLSKLHLFFFQFQFWVRQIAPNDSGNLLHLVAGYNEHSPKEEKKSRVQHHHFRVKLDQHLSHALGWHWNIRTDANGIVIVLLWPQC